MTHVVLGLGELAALASYVALVALMWLNLRARHGSTPEEQEQNDDRDWNAKQPQKCASSHSCLRLFLLKQRRDLISVPIGHARSNATFGMYASCLTQAGDLLPTFLERS